MPVPDSDSVRTSFLPPVLRFLLRWIRRSFELVGLVSPFRQATNVVAGGNPVSECLMDNAPHGEVGHFASRGVASQPAGAALRGDGDVIYLHSLGLPRLWRPSRFNGKLACGISLRGSRLNRGRLETLPAFPKSGKCRQ